MYVERSDTPRMEVTVGGEVTAVADNTTDIDACANTVNDCILNETILSSSCRVGIGFF